MTLHFSKNNRKVSAISDLLGIPKNSVVAFDQPAGYTCPMANECQSYANKMTGKITDGKNCKFRCYAASLESAFTSVRKAHWRNFDALFGKSIDEMASIIIADMPKGIKVVRIHSSGDFFSRDYFMAWIKVAESLPEIEFFGYTKILPYVQYDKPDNFNLHYSVGGKMDAEHTNEPFAKVVKSVQDAIKIGLPVACETHPADDFLMIKNRVSFALPIHGTQPAKRR